MIVECPVCHQRVRIDDSEIRVAKCPKCANVLPGKQPSPRSATQTPADSVSTLPWKSLSGWKKALLSVMKPRKSSFEQEAEKYADECMLVATLFARGDAASHVTAVSILANSQKDVKFRMIAWARIPAMLRDLGYPLASLRARKVMDGNITWSASTPLDEDVKGLRKFPLVDLVGPEMISWLKANGAL